MLLHSSGFTFAVRSFRRLTLYSRIKSCTFAAPFFKIKKTRCF
jgi:hypothetical protein